MPFRSGLMMGTAGGFEPLNPDRSGRVGGVRYGFIALSARENGLFFVRGQQNASAVG